MAYALLGSIGTATDKTGTADLDLAVATQADAGSLVVAISSFDNTTTTIGPSSDLTISDTKGNTWELISEWTESDGVAGDGQTTGIWVSVLSATLTTSDVISIASASAVTAKAMAATAFSTDASAVALGDGTSLQLASANAGQPGALTLSGMTSREYLFIDACPQERATQVVTPEAGYAEAWSAATAGGVATSNQFAWGSYLILTATGDTADPTLTTGAGHVHVLFALYENAPLIASGEVMLPMGMLGTGRV